MCNGANSASDVEEDLRARRIIELTRPVQILGRCRRWTGQSHGASCKAFPLFLRRVLSRSKCRVLDWCCRPEVGPIPRTHQGGSLEFPPFSLRQPGICESVSVESFRRLALDGVRFAGAPGGPFDVEIPRVLVDLHLPIADLVLGRLTPARFVGRVRLLQPAVHWNVQAGQGPLGGMDIEAFIDLMASNPVLGELDCLLEVSDGQFTVLAQPAVSENVTLDEVSASASLDRGKRVSFGLTARWRENESSQLSMTGHLNAEARKYDMAISAEDIGLVDAVPLVYRQLQRLSAVHVLDGVVDLTLSLKGGTATGDLQSQGFSAVLTAEGLQVEVKGLYGSDSIPIGLGGLSVTAAVSHESGAVKARGTASVASLSVGGVKSDDVVCDFEYAGGVLQVSEIGVLDGR